MFADRKQLYQAQLNTPLGPVLVISDDKYLYLLDFADSPHLERKLKKLQAIIITKEIAPLDSIREELKHYFKGSLREFKTPLCPVGTAFQMNSWEELVKIPYGETRSYLDQARAIGKHTTYRAVANANGANQISIVIPCHRIINNNGGLGGYAGGAARKKWLIEHERRVVC